LNYGQTIWDKIEVLWGMPWGALGELDVNTLKIK